MSARFELLATLEGIRYSSECLCSPTFANTLLIFCVLAEVHLDVSFLVVQGTQIECGIYRGAPMGGAWHRAAATKLSASGPQPMGRYFSYCTYVC